jgi:hypothetical protein
MNPATVCTPLSHEFFGIALRVGVECVRSELPASPIDVSVSYDSAPGASPSPIADGVAQRRDSTVWYGMGLSFAAPPVKNQAVLLEWGGSNSYLARHKWLYSVAVRR